MGNLTKNFSDYELVPERIHKLRHPDTWFLDQKTVNLEQELRNKFGPLTVNDWFWGGRFQYSGFDDGAQRGYGSLSQHRFARALDNKPRDISVQEMYHAIMSDQNYWLNLGLTRIENIQKTPTWLHTDTAWTGLKEILIFNP